MDCDNTIMFVLKLPALYVHKITTYNNVKELANQRPPQAGPSDDVGLPLGLSYVQGVDKVPVLKTVHENPAVEGVFKPTVNCLEVSVATVVGFLVGCHVIQDHLKLYMQSVSQTYFHFVVFRLLPRAQLEPSR